MMKHDALDTGSVSRGPDSRLFQNDQQLILAAVESALASDLRPLSGAPRASIIWSSSARDILSALPRPNAGP